jgi:cadmium resistance protein CadD (predicted permease)
VDLAVVGKAIGMFAVTNVDDVVVLTVFFGQARGRAGALRVVAGQYLGFGAILATSVVGAAGAGLLPESAVAYLGLLPIVLGLRAAWRVWSQGPSGASEEVTPGPSSVGVLAVAIVTFANGGDNIGVYLPVFATTNAVGVVTYCAVFLVMVGLWCAAGRFLATRRPIAQALSRWGHIVLPVVLVGIGLLILIEGGAFGL